MNRKQGMKRGRRVLLKGEEVEYKVLGWIYRANAELAELNLL